MRALPFLSLSGIQLFLAVRVAAQAIPDGSVPTSVETIGNRTEVRGGTLAGTNLFHSFTEFSIPTGGATRFDNPATVTNIINRVTGRSPSFLDGTLGANGTANVFLINPNGIIFGKNARLNVGGSFLASTATSIRFAGGSEFSAANTATTALLSVNVPIGLQFGPAPGEIVARANDGIPSSPNGFPIGLRVFSGRTLALVGGNVRLEGGNLTAFGGRVTVGGAGENSFVSLPPDPLGWRLGFEEVSHFRDIGLSRASIEASGPRGTIDLQGSRITIADSSQIAITTRGKDDAGRVTDGSSPSGNLNVIATDSISLLTPPGASFSSAIIVQTDAAGDSGNISLDTARLSIQDGSAITASTIGEGRAGRLEITASESVEIGGVGRFSPSIVTTSTFPSRGNLFLGNTRSGNGGDIIIRAPRLTLRDGGQIQSTTADRVILGGDGHPVQGFGGRGGTIEIEASGSVEIAGTGRIYRVDLLDRTPREVEISSSISTSTGFEDLQLGGSNTAGSIRLRAGHLRVADGGEILVNSFNSSGEAGNLRVRAGSVSLDNRARLVADSSSGSGGNISISAGEFLSLRRQSSITANAGNNGDGGNITIESPFILAVPSENSDITANAEQGTGGNVTIVTDGMFGIRFRPAVTPLSDITVSSRFAGPGNFTLTRLEIDPQSELVEVPARVVDIDRLIVRTCGPDGRLDRWEFTVTGRGGYPLPPIEPWKYRKAWWIWGGAPPGNPRPLPSRRRCRAARSSRPGHGSSARGKSV